VNIHSFKEKKDKKIKMSMITCYDYWSAQLIEQTEIDCVLVGDSLAMVMHGHKTTLAASTELMALHCRAVVRGAPSKFIVGDMPFMSNRKGLMASMNAVEKIMKSGTQAIKLEGAIGNINLVNHIVHSGVPVMGHLGLTPQSIHQLGGFKVQGREAKAAALLVEHARQLEEAGCFALVLECVPSQLAKTITDQLHIPTIGIGAGPETDGQVLVLQDMLGMNESFKPKFLKSYLEGAKIIKQSLQTYHQEVIDKKFPTKHETYE
jgi:3-methyl-2-oxobutanoate hydroxymethyltransferase